MGEGGPLEPEDDPLWEEACRREEGIRELLKRHNGQRRLRLGEVEDLAWELGVSRATLYRLIERYRAGGTVESVRPRVRGRRTGTRVLAPEREHLIRDTIREVYLKPTRPSLKHVIEQIQLRCRAHGLPAPDQRTVKARVLDIAARVRAAHRGEARTFKTTTATPGIYNAARPLEIVQVDHTQVDVVVVDEETRKPHDGRPWLTLAVDVFTRMVMGFHLSVDPPSCLSISLCLLHAVYDKTAWLQERAINAPWPVAGLPETLHVDNGADFRSRAFDRGCRNEGIKTIWRPPAAPHYSGHVERLIGTMMGAVHLLPGTTFSNPHQRGSYDSKRSARMTLRELECWLGWEIAGGYHQRIHAALHRPPIAVWREHEGQIALRMPQDRMAFWVSFLPEEHRTLRPDGLHLHGLRYWSSALTADLGRTKEKLLVKYDPRDISRVFVQRPSGHFVEARHSELSWPSLSLAEWRAALARKRAQGRGELDARQLYTTAVAQRRIVDAAIQRTAEARTGRNRRARRTKTAVDEVDLGSLKGIDSRIALPDEDVSEIWGDA